MQTFTAVSFSFSILQDFLCLPFFFCPHMQFIHHCPQRGDQTGLKRSRCGHMEDRTYDPCPQGWQSYPKCMHSHMKMLTVTFSSYAKWSHFTFLHFMIRCPIYVYITTESIYIHSDSSVFLLDSKVIGYSWQYRF